MGLSLFERLLDYYGITEKEYSDINFDVTESNFLAGHYFNNVKETSDFIKQSIKEGDKIYIYGDYDADGIMGTSILIKTFQYVSKDVTFHIPSRYLDGYGLTVECAEEIVKNGYKLVITIDNGISAFDAVDYLKKHNVKVVIMDHHSIQGHVPNADYVLHPIYSNLGEVATSGAMVAFLFSLTFLGRFDKYLSTLASVSLISDMMPLISYNRNLLRLVFKNFSDDEFLQFDLLKEGEPFNESTIGLKIAPKINAVGRIVETEEVNKVVELFISDDNEKILNYINWLNDVNEKRKEITKETLSSLPEIPSDKKAIILVTEAKEGLLGLIANHYCSKYNLPTVILTRDSGGDSYKGSCRAPDGFNVMDAFAYAKDVLTTYGGHALAGGCSILIDKYDEFEKLFFEYCEKNPFEAPDKKTIKIGLVDVTYDNYKMIQTFSPFGENWPSPLLQIDGINPNNLHFSKSNEHILSQIGTSTRITGFNFSKEFVSSFERINIYGNLRINKFRGLTTTEFLIKDIKESIK